MPTVSEAAGPFDIPAAPILIPEGPWREIDGCVCAPKGFKAQGAFFCHSLLEGPSDMQM